MVGGLPPRGDSLGPGWMGRTAATEELRLRRGVIRSSLAADVHGVYGYPFMRSTVPKENMTLSGEESLYCLHLGRQPEYNWTPPPVVSKTFFVWRLYPRSNLIKFTASLHGTLLGLINPGVGQGNDWHVEGNCSDRLTAKLHSINKRDTILSPWKCAKTIPSPFSVPTQINGISWKKPI